MKFTLKIAIWTGVCAALLFAGLWVTRLAPPPLNWNDSYENDDDMPLGSSIFFYGLSSLPGQKLQTLNMPLSLALEASDRWSDVPQPATLILIGLNWRGMDEYDIEQLIAFASKGNSVILSSNYLAESLLDSLDLLDHENDDGYGYGTIEYLEFPALGKSFRIADELNQTKNSSYYGGELQRNHFRHCPPGTDTLALADGYLASIVRLPIGKGHFTIGYYPELFSNLLCRNQNRQFALHILQQSHQQGQALVWDEYYKPKNRHNRAELSYILSQPPLKYAYYIILILLFLQVFVNLKRRQRAIPIAQPVENSTLGYAKTISQLYYKRADHANLAAKLAKQFHFFVRSSLRVLSSPSSPEFQQEIVMVTGLEPAEVKKLIRTLNNMSSRDEIAEQDLIELNHLLDNFYKKTK